MRPATRIQSQENSPVSSSTGNSHTKFVRLFSSFGQLGHRNDEAEYRKLVLQNNLKSIKQECDKKDLTFTMGENQFSMLTLDEFKSLYLNLAIPG